MERPTKSNYEAWCGQWRKKFLRQDPLQLCRTLPGLDREGDYLTLRHFGRKYGVHLPTGTIRSMEDDGPVSFSVQLNIYTLFGYATPTARFQDQWVPFRDLKNARPFAPAFQKGVTEPFGLTFSGHKKELSQAMEELGGRKLSYSDVGYQLDAFLWIPIRFLFWDGDEEFPAQGNLLFDNSATDFIHIESIVTIATEGLVRIARTAGLPVHRNAFSNI